MVSSVTPALPAPRRGRFCLNLIAACADRSSPGDCAFRTQTNATRHYSAWWRCAFPASTELARNRLMRWAGIVPVLSSPEPNPHQRPSWRHEGAVTKWAAQRIGLSMSKGGRLTALAASAWLLLVAALCPLGASAGEPGPSKATGYPVLEPSKPEKPAMTADELSKLKKDLSATRDRQAPRGKSGTGAGQRVKP